PRVSHCDRRRPDLCLLWQRADEPHRLVDADPESYQHLGCAVGGDGFRAARTIPIGFAQTRLAYSDAADLLGIDVARCLASAIPVLPVAVVLREDRARRSTEKADSRPPRSEAGQVVTLVLRARLGTGRSGDCSY